MMKTNSKIAHLIAKSSNWGLIAVIVVEIISLIAICVWVHWLLY